MLIGDINGDGRITSIDLIAESLYIVYQPSLSVEQFQAADVNKDGEINILDLIKIRNHISGITIIEEE